MSNRLPHLEAAARSAHIAVGAHEKSAAERALQAGAALIEAKSLVRHGEWRGWLAGTGIPERSAQRYMALARGRLESAIVADLGHAEAARLASLGHSLWPDDDRVRHAEGLDEEHAAEAVWLKREDGAITYAARHVIGSEPAIRMRYRPITKPWLLGLFHDRFPSLEGRIRRLSPEEAEAVIERIERGF